MSNSISIHIKVICGAQPRKKSFEQTMRECLLKDKVLEKCIFFTVHHVLLCVFSGHARQVLLINAHYDMSAHYYIVSHTLITK